jgi:hypothetical protein
MTQLIWNPARRFPDGRMAFLTACCLLLGTVAHEVRGADVVIPAREHSARSGNVVPAEASYSDLVVCHGNGGMQQWEAHVTEAGTYYVHVYYAAAESRPVTLTINEQRQDGNFLARVTGGWTGEHLAWETLGPFDLKQGKNVVRINAAGYMPHLAGLVIANSAKQWDREAFDERFPSIGKRIRDMQRLMAPTRVKLRDMLGTDEIVFIKRFPYTANHYYTEYLNSQWKPGGGIFVLSLKDGAVRQVAAELEGGVFGRFDISFDARKIVFDWKRSNDEGYRIYEVGVDGTGLRQVLAAPDNEAQLVATYRLDYHNGTDDMHPCYLPDGGIAFVSTRCQTSTLCDGRDAFTTTVLYRMDADGGNLRQLSFGALSEFTPTVLPDGRIMYARWEYVDKGAVAAKCIWAMNPDGSASAEIYGNDIDFPTTMIQARPIPGVPNNYVLLGCPHYPQNALGTIVRIDRNEPIRTQDPITYLTPEVKILAEGGWHVLDPASGRMVHDGGGGPLYRDPWPIDVNRCLVAHKPRGFGGCYQPNGYGLYLLEGPGKVTPFYRNPEISCWQPMPLKPRVRPPVLPSACDPELAERNLARCVVTDVYHGLEGVQRGSIHYIRVLEQLARPWTARRFGRLNADEYDQQHAVVSKDTALGLKVQHGIVPVEEDGSAHFLVPANANIFLQVLDADHLAVQTERTFVNYMPGETRSCVGCHETPDDAPASARGTPLALLREPSLPGPQIGETTGRRPLHYPTDVQPVLDRHCVECHDEQKQEGGLDLTGRLTKFFSASYENLIAERRGGRQDRRDPDLVPTIGENHPKTGNVHYLPARSFGSHNSLLIAMLAPDKVRLTGDQARLDRLARLVEAHRDVHLEPAELLKISNWVDTNAQYYGSYYGRRNLQDRDHPDFRPVPTWESAISKQTGTSSASRN